MNYLPAPVTISIISIVASGNFDALTVNFLVPESCRWVEVVVIVVVEDLVAVSHFRKILWQWTFFIAD